MLKAWAEASSKIVENDVHNILSQPIWNNKYIELDLKYFKSLMDKHIYIVGDLWDPEFGFVWSKVQGKGLGHKDYFLWLGLIHAIPGGWKAQLKMGLTNCSAEHDVGKLRTLSDLHDVKVLNAKKIYDFLVASIGSPPTAQAKWQARLKTKNNLDWSAIYDNVYKTTIEVYLRCFQYKILNNCLYLNKQLYIFKIVESPFCTFCNEHEESILHLFVDCRFSAAFFYAIRRWLRSLGLDLPPLSSDIVIFGVTEGEKQITKNVVILVYKFMLYKARQKQKIPTLQEFIEKLKFYQRIERKIAEDKSKIGLHLNKWEPLIPYLS